MKKIVYYVPFLLLTTLAFAQNKSVKTDPTILNDFMAKRFGMFIHWGPVSLRGTEIGWSRGHQVPAAEYDNLYKEFDPVLFNADKWVKTAKAAGMKYITITSKHHDGFCLWPTVYSDYNIMYSPFKRDIVGELAAACKNNGIAFCIYFTILDWHDADYPLHNLGDSIPDPKADMNRFVKKIKNELSELITKYHPYMLWFDGNWEKPWTKEFGQEVYDHIKQLDKKIIVNNRLGKGSHKTITAQTVGDYATPEQEVGEINMKDPWESCITICNQWSWKPNDKMKTAQQSIQTLASTSGGNGNLLFNVGPMMDGRMEDRQIKLLDTIGRWLNKYGESIYGTMGGPYKPNKEWAATRKGSKIYIHLFKQDINAFNLPVISGVKINSIHFLSGENLVFDQTDKIHIKLPAVLPDKNDTVLVMEINTTTEGLPLVMN